MKTVRAYVRVSTTTQGKYGNSLEMQQDKIKAYCQLNDLPEPVFYIDSGISGTKSKNRPQLQRLLSEVQKEDIVCVYSLSRLARKTIDTLQMVEGFNKKNITFTSISENIDTQTPYGKAFLSILAALAQAESEIIAERISDDKENRKEKKKTYCKTLTGYTNTFDIDTEGKRVNGRLEQNEHLNTVKLIFELNQKEKKGAYAIASILNKKGIKPPTGKQFYQSSVLSILNNQIYTPHIQ